MPGVRLARSRTRCSPTAHRSRPSVRAINSSLLVTFNVFAVTMVLQYAKVSRWRDYLTGCGRGRCAGVTSASLVPR